MVYTITNLSSSHAKGVGERGLPATPRPSLQPLVYWLMGAVLFWGGFELEYLIGSTLKTGLKHVLITIIMISIYKRIKNTKAFLCAI